ncbi:MAG: TetR/AcrR family transcriptional regulator [Actinomycetota bacterium]|nr:TetR/AcrR family transcriptional regulator [Actinomycetota bacterium]
MATDPQREKRRLILRAAITVFARSGYHTSRVSDVAKEAGVAYGLVYHYFGSKEDLLETIFRRTWSRMLEAVKVVEQEGASAREQLAGVAHIVLGGWLADPDLVRVLVREVARSPQLGREVDEISHAFEALERIVARGQERGELRPGIDPKLAAWVLYGALEEILTGWVFERLPAGAEDVERAEKTVVELLTDGLAVD